MGKLKSCLCSKADALQKHTVNLTCCRTAAGIAIFHTRIPGKGLQPALMSSNEGDQVLILPHLFLIQYLFISRGKWGILQSFQRQFSWAQPPRLLFLHCCLGYIEKNVDGNVSDCWLAVAGRRIPQIRIVPVVHWRHFYKFSNAAMIILLLASQLTSTAHIVPCQISYFVRCQRAVLFSFQIAGLISGST